MSNVENVKPVTRGVAEGLEYNRRVECEECVVSRSDDVGRTDVGRMCEGGGKEEGRMCEGGGKEEGRRREGGAKEEGRRGDKRAARKTAK
eukprot:765726-Hanusia_phi.AAC.1